MKKIFEILTTNQSDCASRLGLIFCVFVSFVFYSETGWAYTTLSLTARDDANAAAVSYAGDDPLSIEKTISSGSSSAYGSVDISTGILRAYDISGMPYSSGSTVYSNTFAQTLAVFGDSFQFTSGYGQIAYLDWKFDGAFTTNIDKGVESFSGAQFSISLLKDGADAAFMSSLIINGGIGCDGYSVTYCTIGSTINSSGTLELLIGPETYSLVSTLVAGAVLGDTADFGSTARVIFRLPEGVGIISESGRLLTNAIDNTVPEPSTILLLLASLGLIGVRSSQANRVSLIRTRL